MYRRIGFGLLLAATVTASACNTGGGLVSANNPLNPTPAPTGAATPTPVPSGGATPTPSPTPTAAACSAPPPDPNTATITLTGNKQTITVPCFGPFNSTAVVPAGSDAGLTVALAASTDKNLGGVSDPTYGKPLEYTSLQPSAQIIFTGANPAIVTTLTSPAIAAPHTYAMQVYVPAFFAAIQTVTGLHPSGHSITFSVVPPGGAFPPVEAVVIVYQSS
jgi:hypothetical protein